MANYTGVVKWFDPERGYGFISSSEGGDVFVHVSHISEDVHNRELHEGQEVTFDVVQADRGPSAVNVQKM